MTSPVFRFDENPLFTAGAPSFAEDPCNCCEPGDPCNYPWRMPQNHADLCDDLNEAIYLRYLMADGDYNSEGAGYYFPQAETAVGAIGSIASQFYNPPQQGSKRRRYDLKVDSKVFAEAGFEGLSYENFFLTSIFPFTVPPDLPALGPPSGVNSAYINLTVGEVGTDGTPTSWWVLDYGGSGYQGQLLANDDFRSTFEIGIEVRSNWPTTNNVAVFWFLDLVVIDTQLFNNPILAAGLSNECDVWMLAELVVNGGGYFPGFDQITSVSDGQGIP